MMLSHRLFCSIERMVLVLALGLSAAGCGTIKTHTATEQLLASDAVDRAVGSIDFRVLAGQKVFLDTKYLKPIKVKSGEFVTADYLIATLRQQMIAADCLLQKDDTTADIIVEASVGAIGTDSHDVTYGLPASKLMTTATSMVPTLPTLPSLPELSLAKKTDQFAVAKLSLIAYDRETRHPVWQSGIAQARSTATDTVILGAGPFQRGTIYDGTLFAGSKIGIPLFGTEEEENKRRPIITRDKEVYFANQDRKKLSAVQQASAEEAEKDEPEAEKPSETKPAEVKPAAVEVKPPAAKPAEEKPAAATEKKAPEEPPSLGKWKPRK